MTNINTTKIVEQFLSLVPQFNQLPPEVISELATKLKPLRFGVGKVMIMKDKMQGQIAIISEGEVRVLGYDPRTKMPTTLDKLKPGEIIGWVNLARDLPCETAMASTEVVCLALDNQEFLQLIEQYPQLQQEFKTKAAKVEVFDLLGIQLEQEAQGDWELAELATQATAEAQVYYLPPGEHKLNSEAIAPLQDPNLVWLVSGGGAIEGFPVGSRLELTKDRQSLTVKGSKPVRLVSIPRDKWFDPEVAPAIESLVTESVNGSGIVFDRDIEEPEGPLVDEDYSFQEEDVTPREPKDYPFVGGKTTLDVGVACFQMLSKYFGMPFRKEVIRRVLSEQLERTGSFSLPLCGAVSELMGLNPQLINIPAKAITRIEGPCLVRWQDSLAVIYESSESEMVIAVPELGGVRRYQPSDFTDTWGEGGEVLLLKKTKETPQERFGLSWFLPSLAKYKRVLIEVFVASFFVQLFALANPLMIQVIIDKVISQNSVDTLGY